jgi:hypothetical protein
MLLQYAVSCSPSWHGCNLREQAAVPSMNNPWPRMPSGLTGDPPRDYATEKQKFLLRKTCRSGPGNFFKPNMSCFQTWDSPQLAVAWHAGSGLCIRHPIHVGDGRSQSSL